MLGQWPVLTALLSALARLVYFSCFAVFPFFLFIYIIPWDYVCFCTILDFLCVFFEEIMFPIVFFAVFDCCVDVVACAACLF